MTTKQGLSFVTFPLLERTGLVEHGFSTRTGGVSKGCYESLDLSYTRGDDETDVDENFRRAAAFFHALPSQIVCGQQTHTANIRRVSAEDAGKGVTRERNYRDIDGLVTDIPGLLLCTFHADCTPVFLLDPVHRAIGMVHSGWRGTVQKIGQAALDTMKTEFGTDPGDVIAAIGPCICGNCYEVGPEVAEQFAAMYGEEIIEEGPENAGSLSWGRKWGKEGQMLLHRENGRFLLDQKAANLRILTDAGLRQENISISSECTYHQAERYYSHRRMGNARGSMAAFLMLK